MKKKKTQTKQNNKSNEHWPNKTRDCIKWPNGYGRALDVDAFNRDNSFLFDSTVLLFDLNVWKVYLKKKKKNTKK